MNFEQIIQDERSNAMQIGYDKGMSKGISKGISKGMSKGIKKGKLQGIEQEKKSGKRILYESLINKGISDREARATADQAYPQVPLSY